MVPILTAFAAIEDIAGPISTDVSDTNGCVVVFTTGADVVGADVCCLGAGPVDPPRIVGAVNDELAKADVIDAIHPLAAVNTF